MMYDELHQRYGSRIANRLMTELSPSELKRVELHDLGAYLDLRATAAYKEYHMHHDNPFDEVGAKRAQHMDKLCQRWRDAEDLASLVSVAEDVGSAPRRIANGEA